MAQKEDKADRTMSIPTKDILSWTFDNPQFDQDKKIYIDAVNPSRSITAREARTLIRKMVAGLRAAGLQKEDCVYLHSFNDIYYPIIFLSVIAADEVWTGTNPGYISFELEHHIKTSQASFIISELDLALFNNILRTAEMCNIPKKNIFISDTKDTEKVPTGYKSTGFNDLGTCKTTTAARLFSSGTTGLPKAALLSHYNLIAEHTVVHEAYPKLWEVKRLICVPFFRAASVSGVHTTPLRAGHVTYVMRRFELESYLQNLEKWEIPEISLVPPLVTATIMSPLSKKYSLKKAIYATCGAAPLDKEPQQQFLLLMHPDARFTQVWGMTEITCVAMSFPWDEHDFLGSVGRLVPNMEAKLIDHNGKDISQYDVRGELCVRVPLVIEGYFQNPQANVESFQNGWFHTGDIAYCEGASKKWYIVDRKKELIKVRGFQVAPSELEGVLLSHPHIADAAVIGVPASASEGELLRAYVVRMPGPEADKLDEKDVKNYGGKRLAKYKRLDGGVAFVDSIPRNASGKILRRILREQARKGMRAKI
ncbi:AMP-binding enzyme [Mytilinidion resinicola]|uniref:AMP-binding enzyme n=1 Tax=Mytilinidion resinicola TaxID=574789 RepID=A0A6A6YFG9_9PEZI|nr:AMP-binding enzyme [Mytilinidion resinicola]KAF2806774.1 AMP-binding enzyme [Mytilinidion resinicola]